MRLNGCFEEKELSDADASGFTSSSSLLTGAGTSAGEGATILRKFMMRCTAMFFGGCTEQRKE